MEMNRGNRVQESLQELLDTSGDAITVTDADGHILSCNATAEQLYGRSAGALIGTDFASLWSRTTAEQLRSRARELATGAGTADFLGELDAPRCVCESGKLRLRASLYRQAAGAAPRIMYAASCADRPTGPRLGIRENRLDMRAGVGASLVLCAHLDAELRYLDANPAYEMWVGCAPGTLVGRRFADVVGEQAFVSWKPLLGRALGGEPVCMHATLFHHSGSSAPFTLYLAPDGDSNAGSTGCWLVAGGDRESTASQIDQMHFEQKMRETLVREVHHRVKNSLQGIVGMLRANTASQPELTAVIDPVIAQLRAVAVGFGLTSRRGNARLLLCELVREIACNITEVTKRPVEVLLNEQVRARPVAIRTTDAVNLSLVINELIFNAVKHSPAQPNAAVRVDVARDAEAASLMVHNAGGRLPRGFDLEQGTGLGTGLNLIQILLPPGSAALLIAERDGGVTAELRLRSPTVRTNIIDMNSALRDPSTRMR